MDPGPYLPPPVPADNPPEAPQRSPRKTLIMWVVLVGCFLAIYQILRAPGDHPPRPRRPAISHQGSAPLPPSDPRDAADWWGRGVPIGLALALIGGFIFLVRWQIRGGNRFNLAQEEGLLAMVLGDPARAAQSYEGLLKTYRGQVQYAAMARYNLGRALLQGGQVDQAAALFVQVERTPGLLYAAELRLLAGVSLCEIYAVRGELDAARRWLAECRRRLSRTGSRLYPAAALRLTEVVLLCREGRYAEARAVLDQDQRRMEGSLTVYGMRPVWLLRAFVTAQLAGPREHGEAARWLAHLQPARPGEFTPWLQRWPELRLFVAAHLEGQSA